jgi:hypothetical protein
LSLWGVQSGGPCCRGLHKWATRSSKRTTCTTLKMQKVVILS